MAINIRHHIANITTNNNNNDCWAVSTAMVMHRHSMHGTDHVKALANLARVPLDQAGSLPDSSVRSFANAVHLGFHDFQNTTLTMGKLESLLRRGPVVAFGFFNYPGVQASLKHAVAIYALIGNGTERGTKVYLMDPASAANPFSDDWQHFDASVADITFVLSH